MTEMKTFRFWHNNTGGFYIDIEAICPPSQISLVGHDVYIEAENAGEANKLAEENGIYFDGVSKGIDCSCCGDRWFRAIYPEIEEEED